MTVAIKNKQFGDIPRNGPVGPWTDRVAYSARGYAYRPDELLCFVEGDREEAFETVRRLVPQAQFPDEPMGTGDYLITSDKPFDVEAVVDEMRRRGFAVDPNYVVFGHSCCCGSGAPIAASPFYANPFYANALSGATATGIEANPFYANALSANPFYANPFYANPFYANPFYANEYQKSGTRSSSAMPATAPESSKKSFAEIPDERAKVIILDTGLAAEPPGLLGAQNYKDTDTGDRDAPDESTPRDNLLDPAAGHGTFIAGIVEQIAPRQQTIVCRVLSTFGDGDVADIAERLDRLRTSPKPGQEIDDTTIINLSFGGYADVAMPTLRRAIEAIQELGAVIVASAGNDGLCQMMYPAAFPGVIGVGSIEPAGRAFYSNHGPWVRACAPGTHLTSAFHTFNGAHPSDAGADPDEFEEWAHWTGTSFAAPIVAAALARHIALTNGSAADAVRAVIDAPGLFRYPGLGTVVNLTPGM